MQSGHDDDAKVLIRILNHMEETENRVFQIKPLGISVRYENNFITPELICPNYKHVIVVIPSFFSNTLRCSLNIKYIYSSKYCIFTFKTTNHVTERCVTFKMLWNFQFNLIASLYILEILHTVS